MRPGLPIVILMFLLVSACSSIPQGPTLEVEAIATSARVDLSEPAAARAALHAQHRDWAGTPYRFGGMSKAGVDCSGFIWNTFAHRFGLNLPRTTDDLIRVGRFVEKSQLTAGDLVFFQTGYSKLHVGIYVDAGRFLHASTSRGVMISHLRNPYWSEHFWHARRIRD